MQMKNHLGWDKQDNQWELLGGGGDPALITLKGRL